MLKGFELSLSVKPGLTTDAALDQATLSKLWARASSIVHTVSGIPQSLHQLSAILGLDTGSYVLSEMAELLATLPKERIADLEPDQRRRINDYLKRESQQFQIPFSSLHTVCTFESANGTAAKARTRLLLRMTGSLMEMFSIAILLALFSEGTSRITQCPECRLAFFRIRKQKYCSKRCINRVSRRTWLRNPANREKEAEWAHERYRRRVRKKTGPKAVVRRRPQPTEKSRQQSQGGRD
jgi:hypothetical protein